VASIEAATLQEILKGGRAAVARDHAITRGTSQSVIFAGGRIDPLGFLKKEFSNDKGVVCLFLSS